MLISSQVCDSWKLVPRTILPSPEIENYIKFEIIYILSTKFGLEYIWLSKTIK
jgi:hypothetical protein